MMSVRQRIDPLLVENGEAILRLLETKLAQSRHDLKRFSMRRKKQQDPSA